MRRASGTPPTAPQHEEFAAPVELVHAIGYAGKHPQALKFHPTIEDTAIHPIGRLLLVTDLNDPHRQHILRSHDAEVTCVAASCNGQFLCSGQAASPTKEASSPLAVWKYHSRELLYLMRGHRGDTTCCAFSPDDRWLASTGTDGALAIWDLEAGEYSGGHKDPPTQQYLSVPRWVAWASMESNTRRPRYTLVVGHERDIRVYVWELNIKTMAFNLAQTVCQVPLASGGGLSRVYTAGCLNPSGTTCLAGTTSGDVVVYSVANAVFRFAFPVGAAVAAIVFAGEGCALVGTVDGKLKKVLGSEKSWRLAGEVHLGAPVTALSLSADAAELLVGTSGGSLLRVLVSDLAFTTHSHSHTAAVRDLAFTPVRADLFVSCADDGSLRLWDLSDYTVCSAYHPPIPSPANPVLPTAVSFLDRRSLAVLSGWSDGSVRCVDFAVPGAAPVLWTLPNAHRAPLTALVSAQAYFCTAAQDGSVRAWAPANRELLIQIAEHTRGVTGLVVDNTTEAILHTAGADRQCFTYDLFRSETARTAKRITYHTDQHGTGLAAVDQRTDNEHELIAATADGRVLFFDIDYFEPTVVAADPSRSRYTCLAVSPSGRYLALGTADGVLQLMDLTGCTRAGVPPTLLGASRCHATDILRLRWSPDEKQIVTAGQDCAMCVWNFYAADPHPSR